MIRAEMKQGGKHPTEIWLACAPAKARSGASTWPDAAREGVCAFAERYSSTMTFHEIGLSDIAEKFGSCAATATVIVGAVLNHFGRWEDGTQLSEAMALAVLAIATNQGFDPDNLTDEELHGSLRPRGLILADDYDNIDLDYVLSITPTRKTGAA